MAEVVNFRQARKAKARATKETTADANRAAFGRTKGEKMTEKAEATQRERTLDGAKRE